MLKPSGVLETTLSTNQKRSRCAEGEAPSWHLTGAEPGANEHWLYHGTSVAGEAGITEGDFRLNLAGSNAGTLYGTELRRATSLLALAESKVSHVQSA